MSRAGIPLGVIPEWHERALCREIGWEMFFIDKGESPRPAKKLCGGCEVKSECLESALADPDTKGVWGGTTEKQRARIRRERGEEAA